MPSTILISAISSVNFLFAKAPAKHVVQLAKAEVDKNPNATRAMKKFAAIRLKDAEQGVHKLLREEGPSTSGEVHCGAATYTSLHQALVMGHG